MTGEDVPPSAVRRMALDQMASLSSLEARNATFLLALI
jgi:hypothetical protein